MKNHYDKLLLLIAICALAIGGVLYKQDAPGAAKGASIGTGVYTPVQVTPIETVETNWVKPEMQASGFRYDVFTPFSIYINEKGEFTQERPDVDPPVINVFDATLISIAREPYRVQLEGFIDEGDGNVLFLFHDVELGKTVRARTGKEAPASEFKVLGADVTLVEGPDGSRTRIAKATILDMRTQLEVVLTHRELLFNDAVKIIVGSSEDSSFQQELSEVGETFTTEHGTYTLQEINLEGNSITVEKSATEDHEAESKILVPQIQESQEERTIDEEIIDPSTAPDTAFDLFFTN